eukprot:scaffold2254_cov393-Prasinococcus_capsulatus_cf.AAC.10
MDPRGWGRRSNETLAKGGVFLDRDGPGLGHAEPQFNPVPDAAPLISHRRPPRRGPARPECRLKGRSWRAQPARATTRPPRRIISSSSSSSSVVVVVVVVVVALGEGAEGWCAGLQACICFVGGPVWSGCASRRGCARPAGGAQKARPGLPPDVTCKASLSWAGGDASPQGCRQRQRALVAPGTSSSGVSLPASPPCALSLGAGDCLVVASRSVWSSRRSVRCRAVQGFRK